MPAHDQQALGASQARDRTLSLNSGASPFKRQKLDSHQPQTPPSRDKAPAVYSAMYTFSPSKNSPFIDLTDPSPASSPGLVSPVKSNGVIRLANANSTNKPKKFAVKNLRTTNPTDPQVYFDRVWKQLDGAFKSTLVENGRPESLEELYKSVEYVCRQGKAEDLFEKVKRRCREHVTGLVRGSINAAATAPQSTSEQVLVQTVKAWSTWTKQMGLMKSVLLYLNQSYLINSKKHPTIDELSMQLFRKHIFQDTTLHPLLIEGMCQLVASDRESLSSFDADVFRASVEMLHSLHVYTKTFEPKLLAESQAYFNTWASQHVAKLALPDYVAACWKLMDKEKKRCDDFKLDTSTQRNISEQMTTFLVDNQLEALTDTESVGDLAGNDKLEDLKQLYKLLQLKNHGAKLRSPFESFVESAGEAIIFDEKREQEMVPRLLAFKRKNDKIWTDSFERQPDLGIGLREAFRKFINKTKKSNMTWGTDNEKAGEMIAKYVDMLLRGGLKAIQDDGDGDEDEDMDGDEKMNQQLDQVLELFRFLNGKAVFEAFYKKDLAKRLLLKQSANDGAEKSMLERLKNECGANFTSNLEQMFKDIDLSRDENAAYKMRRSDRNEKGGPDLEVSVLESSAWPSYPDVPIEIPPDIQDAVKKFEDHYQSHHTGRRLAWKHDRAHCQLTARFDKNYVIVVSAFQAIVLLHFNGKPNNDPATYSELREATKLSDANLVRTLQSLACARFKVLKKSTKGPEVKDTDTFTVNTSFKTEKVRFRINQIQLRETKEENKATHERVAADREFETQAAIVRIMKSEQKIKHQNLIVKVIDALKKRGAVQPEDIKKQIDKLIDKDYMERLEDNMYEYVA